MLRLVLITYVSLCIGSLNAVLYDCLTGTPANETLLKLYKKRNNTDICTVDIKPCDPKEWRRLDGSCTNLKFPSRGTQRTPTLRLLPHDFCPNFEPRKANDGNELPLARSIRWELLHLGKASDLRVTQLATYFLLFYLGDIVSLHDIMNYVLFIPDCCKSKGKSDYRCSPITVPRVDPVHRFSGMSCFNLTKPIGFHFYNCTDKGAPFTRLVFATSALDMSQTYNPMPGNIDKLRSYKHGLLIIEEENGMLFPPSEPNTILCALNQRPRETRCNKYHTNPSIGSEIMNILFYRFHNHIARKLRKLNPCWDDERLFYTARDINIAISNKIFFYDLMPVFLGKMNMLREGIISCSDGFRDMYDESISPQITDEYIMIQRWFHNIQETTIKFYDKDGFFVKTFPMVNATTRTGLLTVDNNMECIIQGSFRQFCGAFDHTMDIDMGENVLGPLQTASDVGSSDLFKTRLFGFAPYVKYREYCARRPVRRYSDLKYDISPERLNRLQEVYQHPKDIDLIAGTWVEKHVEGGRVPKTVYCLMVEQLKRFIRCDRHWFERCNRPHAFTLGQLKAVRETSIAGILCDVGTSVSAVQPNAFYGASQENPMTQCSSSIMGKLDLSPWKDPQCCS